uniref:Uncharacterized protein n=1 Tax=Athene cunicularia TaxID=194338 RepID=A0A663LXM5_ATHCN
VLSRAERRLDLKSPNVDLFHNQKTQRCIWMEGLRCMRRLAGLLGLCRQSHLDKVSQTLKSVLLVSCEKKSRLPSESKDGYISMIYT